MKRVWQTIKTILAIIGGVAIAVVVMRGARIRWADTAAGVVSDTRERINGVENGIRDATQANRRATDALAAGRVSIADSAGVVDELDASIGRGQSILDDVEGRR